MEYRNEMYPDKDCPENTAEKEGCYKECDFFTGVSLPLEIKPEAKVGDIEVECLGDPEVKKICTEDCSHKIVITQNFFVKVPVCYYIKTAVGKCDSICKDKKQEGI
ncbi:MAG: hypothetical protein IJ408_03925 [Clostridia bacterium]|nr:hypothetical protein [Clostridia bacterium]